MTTRTFSHIYRLSLVATSCLLSACSTVFDPAPQSMRSNFAAMSADQSQPMLAMSQIDIPLPLVMLDRLDQEASIPIDNNPSTDKTPEEIAIEEETERQRVEIEELRMAEMKAVKDAGLCEGAVSEIPPACLYGTLSSSIEAIEIPRFAAPFQVQFLMNEAGAPTDALLAKFPKLQEWEARHVCGGSLIAPGWAITAAHCFAQPNADRSNFTIPSYAFSIRLDVENIAVTDAKTLPIDKIIVHPDYKVSNNNHDLALVRFDAALMGTIGDIRWFEGTGISSDNRLKSVVLARDGIELQDKNNQNLILNTRTRTLTQNPYLPPRNSAVPPRYRLSVWETGQIFLTDTDTEQRTEIGRTTLEYAQEGVSPDGQYIVLNHRKMKSEIWSVSKKKRLATFDAPPNYHTSKPIRFSRDGTKFHLWSREGESQIRETKTGKLLSSFNHSLPVDDTRIGPNGQIIIEGSIGHVELLDLEEERQTFRAYHGGGEVQTDWDDTRLLTWTRDGRVRIFDWKTGKQTFHYVHSKDAILDTAYSGVPAEPARLQKVRLSTSNPTPTQESVLSAYGWGKTHFERNNVASAILRQLSLAPISWGECNRLRNERNSRNGRVNARRSRSDPSAFCAIGAGRKTCRGDSGGPLLEGTELVGVVSRGSGACWSDEAPTTFASIPKASEWIRREICKPPIGGFAQTDGSSWGSLPKMPELCETQSPMS